MAQIWWSVEYRRMTWSYFFTTLKGCSLQTSVLSPLPIIGSYALPLLLQVFYLAHSIDLNDTFSTDLFVNLTNISSLDEHRALYYSEIILKFSINLSFLYTSRFLFAFTTAEMPFHVIVQLSMLSLWKNLVHQNNHLML